MERRTHLVTQAIERLARPQHGCLARRQLLRVGFARGLIEGRVRCGHLVPGYFGVYSVRAGRVGRPSVWMMGMLAAGDHAVLSHLSAAVLWGISDLLGPTEVTRVGKSRTIRPVPARSVAGPVLNEAGKALTVVRVHGTRSLPANQIRTFDGLRVTSVSRTVVDLASRLDRHQLEALMHEAARGEILDFEELRRTLGQCRGKKGTNVVARLVATWDPSVSRTRSVLEAEALKLCRRHSIPAPEVNAEVAGMMVDLHWREEGLVVELDGRRDHARGRGFETDRQRTAELELAGLRVLRLTWEMVKNEPERTAEKIKAYLDLAIRQEVR